MPFKKIGSKSVGKAIKVNRNRDTSLDTSVNSDRTVNAVYKYTNNTQTTLTVEPWVQSARFIGVAMGGNGGSSGKGSPFNDGGGGKGAGGGAGQFFGYDLNVADLQGQTLYIGVGQNPGSVRNTYVKTGSHSGTSIFELNRGSPGGEGGAGGAASGVYGDTAGSNGGGPGFPGGPNPGGAARPGTPVENAGAGGGSGGNVYGNYTGPGGIANVSPNAASPRVNPSNYWLRNNNTDFAVGVGSVTGDPTSGNYGGNGGGFELDGTVYGGGGGGGGTNAGSPPRGGRAGLGGALVIEFSSTKV
jgi:hypothetical protein